MMPILDEEQQCLFCGKPKTWKSILICLDPRTAKLPLFIVTICPKCRKSHTMQQVYEAALAKIHKQTEEYLEKWRAEASSVIFTIPRRRQHNE